MAQRSSHNFLSTAHLSSECGVALVTALMAMLLLTALGFALVLTTMSETMIAGNYRGSQEALYAADAGLERTMQDLLTVPDWNTVLAGATKSAFIDSENPGFRLLRDGKTLDLNEATNMINCGKTTTCSVSEMNATTEDRPWGMNNPRYQLYGYGPVNDFIPSGELSSDLYVVVWLGDDPSENDNDPTKDGNAQTNPGTGVLTMRAEAFGPGGIHKIVEITVARTDSAEIERGYTGQRGQDEQNRRARKAAVQTPGKSLERQELNLGTGTIM
jgi:Tfp pilus assembly protein PilX